jgi:predicted nucleic acid-binding protein
MFVLDSSAIVELLLAGPRGIKITGITHGHPLATTSVCYVEVMVGMKGKDKEAAQQFFDAVPIYPLDKNAAKVAIELQEKLYGCGKPLGRGDLLAAAICVDKQLPIITCDDDFIRVKGLKVVHVE